MCFLMPVMIESAFSGLNVPIEVYFAHMPMETYLTNLYERCHSIWYRLNLWKEYSCYDQKWIPFRQISFAGVVYVRNKCNHLKKWLEKLFCLSNYRLAIYSRLEEWFDIYGNNSYQNLFDTI
ncbi:hypothetical protein SAY86_020657 [Trapa natans]|uniref:Uncharacterized protein n=1 Tax=Trapa natans TaxID=22666 RepID=A0AAN7M008_TRANT|nr:hypothetical protein SAY86_020657 [Trapa natans]